MSIYQQISDDIRLKIVNKTYPKDTKIPNQNELALMYQTSRVTVQKALEVLYLEGFLYSKRGVGIFVKEETSLFDTSASEYDGVTKRYSQLGKVTSEIIAFDVRFPDEMEQNKLRINKQEPVYDIIRLRFLNKEPFVLEYTIMPIYVIPGITESVLKKSIYKYITNDLHLKIKSSIRRFRADKPDAYDQKYLECKIDDPVLEVDQVVYLENGTPFEYSQTRHRYDKGDYMITNIKY